MRPDYEQITSLQNPRVKQVRKLRERRTRDQLGLFVVDDTRDLKRALDCGYSAQYCFYCPELDSNPPPESIQYVYETPRALMEKVSYRQNPSGLVAVLEQKQTHSLAKLDNVNSHILVLVNLRKPGNIGALLRTADATGFRAVMLADTAPDIYNPNVIRSSTGACFLNNVYAASTVEALKFLKSHEIPILAADVDGDVSLYETHFISKSAIALGTEDTGLDPIWLETADYRVQIPMIGTLTDSFNVSASGAIFMYEALRQQITQNGL